MRPENRRCWDPREFSLPPSNPSIDTVKKAREHEASRTPEQRAALKLAGEIYRDPTTQDYGKTYAGTLIRFANGDK